MPGTARAQSDTQENPKTENAGRDSCLTEGQKDATVQKWADWIWKQRQTAARERKKGDSE